MTDDFLSLNPGPTGSGSRRRLLSVRRCALAVAVSGILAAGSLAAQEDEGGEEREDRDRLTLTAVSITGSADDIREIPGSAHAFTRDEIEASGYSDPHRMLRGMPGVYIQEEEGFGLFPNISIRGSRSERARRITMMEDGILAAPAPYAAPAAYHMPTALRMHRLEVRKGSSSIQYGPYTTGGALNMVSTPIPDTFTGRAQMMLGSDGGRRNLAMLGGGSGDWSFLIEGVDAGSDGFKRLDLPTGGPNAPGADTGFDLRDVVGKLRWEPGMGDHAFELKLGRVTRTANETYLGLIQEDFDRSPYRRYAGSQLDQINTEHEQFSLSHQWYSGAGNLTTTIYNNDFARNWYKLHEVWGGQGDPDFTGIASVIDNPEQFAAELAWLRGEGGDALGNLRANNREYYSRGIQSVFETSFDTGDWSHQLEAGIRLHYDEEDRLQWQDTFAMNNLALTRVQPGSRPGAESGVPGSTTNRVTEAEALAVHVQDRIRHGNWTLIPGLRFERIEIDRVDFRQGDNPTRDVITGERSNDFSVFIPGFGAVYQVNPALRAFVGIHKGFAPTGASPNVDEEESWNFETGLRYARDGLRAEAIGFVNAFDNLVGTCTAASGGTCEVGDQFQAGEVDVTGLELLVGYDFARNFDLPISLPFEVAYTYTDTEFKESFESDFGEWGEVFQGDELPHIPSNQVNVTLQAVASDWRVRLSTNYVDQTRSRAGSGPIPDGEAIDSRWLVDLSGEYEFHPGIRLFASVENLFDETYLAARTPAGPRPGQPRTSWAGIRLNF